MKKEHLSMVDNLVLNNKPYKQSTFKPTGLWYQIDNSWVDWVASEMPEWLLKRCNYKYQIDIDMTNILVIDSIDKMYKFNVNYKVFDGKGLSRHNQSIDWFQVALDYDGIEIPHYFHSLRLHEDFMWYYSWDVASGCVWNTDKIKSLTKLEFSSADYYCKAAD